MVLVLVVTIQQDELDDAVRTRLVKRCSREGGRGR